ncbi:MAG: division/cell wall cluster transcriptional repressor MraZ [Candidatus Latescibacterota bacterium]|nr:MAG: division/cell wall cluster transcriptional repressor MraZ [Candidatus Latescibacterota bacterium]
MADFVGYYEVTVDDKGRLYVPAAFRKALPPEANDTFVITKWFEGCLAVYGPDYWERLKKRLRSKLSPMREKDRRFLRLLIPQAIEVRVDRQGRINIPKRLLKFAQIKDRAVAAGVLDYFELWNPEIYEEHLKGSEMTELSEVLEL